MKQLIRYNSLPLLADHIVNHPNSHYESIGVDVAHNKIVFNSVDELDIRPYDTIFINAMLLEENISKLLKCKTPFHLVTGNSDFEIKPRRIALLLSLDNLITWAGHNLWKLADNMLTIPIGFSETGQNRPQSEVWPDTSAYEKDMKIVLTPLSNTNAERHSINLDKFKNVKKYIEKVPYFNYLEILAKSEYSICPRGNGVDTHRVYESIAMNSVPIVRPGMLSSLYQDLGCIEIENWDALDETALTLNKLNRDAIYLDYWKNKHIEFKKLFEQKKNLGIFNEHKR
jgi:hypothetical protein